MVVRTSDDFEFRLGSLSVSIRVGIVLSTNRAASEVEKRGGGQ